MTEPRPDAIPEHGRIMAVDYGTVRLGIALSDGLRMAANAHEVIAANAPDLIERLMVIIDEYGVTAVVVGLPIALNGSDTSSTAGARKLAARFTVSFGVPVVLYDERFTTNVAERSLLAADTSRRKRRQMVDKVAAAVLLQGYLDHLAAVR
jgi:putative Holliday junction resolvase